MATALPSDFPNLQGWFKADSETYNNGDAVGTVTDRSGNARHWTQGTAANKPAFKTAALNGLPAYSYVYDGANSKVVDGSNLDQYLAAAAFTAYLFFMPSTITTDTTTGNGENTVFGVAGVSIGMTLRSSGLLRNLNNDGAIKSVEKAGLQINVGTLGLHMHSGGNIFAGVNDLTTAALASTASGNDTDMARPMRLGLSNAADTGQFRGYLFEGCFYNVAHDEATRTSLQQYFDFKYRQNPLAEAARNKGSRILRLVRQGIPMITARGLRPAWAAA